MWSALVWALASAPAPAASPAALTALHIGTSVVVTGIGAGLAFGVQAALFEAEGNVRPGFAVLTAAISSVAVVGLTQVLLPRWSVGREGPAGRKAFLWGLGPAAAAGIGLVLTGVGSALEGNRYGSGQILMASGIVTVVLGVLIHQVLAPIGAAQGHWSVL